MTISNGQSTPYPGARAYTAPGITVFYDRDRCVHFGECVRGLPTVFDVTRKPWIEAANAEPNAVADVVERCPSGALHYGMPERVETPDTTTVVHETDFRQIELRGALSLRSEAGEEILHDTRLTVCGCGRSERRPLCDGGCERTMGT